MADEWPDGWPAEAIQKIEELEAEKDRLQNQAGELSRKLVRFQRHAKCQGRILRARKAENARLREIISDPVETFGTPELIAWADRLQEILAEYPEGERDSIAFFFTMGDHLEKFVKAWNSPTIAAKDARIADLEAVLKNIVAADEDLSNHNYWMQDDVTDEQWDEEVEYGKRVFLSIEKARALLPGAGVKAAPEEGEDG